MAKVLLIGGAPRVGKTTLTLRLLHRQPMLATSTDALRYTLRRIITKETEPDLFNLGKFTSDDPVKRQQLVEHADKVVDLQNKESIVV